MASSEPAALPAADVGTLPADVQRLLQRALLPAQALSVVVHEVGRPQPLLAWQASQAVNPASLAKLFVTAAALDQLGPAWTWATPVWLAGPVRDGVLEGALHIKGSGDPKLVLERLWLLLRRVRQLGVREIRGDIVLDNSAFAADDTEPGAFDGEPARPYNVRADALLFNHKAVHYSFVPEPAQGSARVLVEPPLAGAPAPRSVPLAGGPCGDWRSALKPQWADGGQLRFAGHYPTACGELNWALADLSPATYNARLLQGLWQEMGGRLGGRVRDGLAPAATAPTFELQSPPLLEVVREINKFSNNVMAQQLFLTLAAQQAGGGGATPATAREGLRQWITTRLGEPGGELVVDNGSGLSREGRASARLLARLLLLAERSPWAAEMASSLPISGVDGTMRRARGATGRAHLKTGSLRDVMGVAGYVLGDSGRRYVLAAIVNHAQAAGARPALDALLQWVQQDAPGR
ncbi:D-alanyl-D-alanine carboxypeptidase/D-alanyl-D-alanine endopeptidase [Pseudorhodoferax sp.]|uniref:D-alanyl-D-alanine carboxypeptidase/D-alanyl-D-alanine endopeptidase n=1 Tax=Pseudorhodoferax sp. TaxID=1993553 RepID=UPI002DD63E43|nr:D-alanyl-D-alanine carboxypeptidase/D-alanyl-D-alanine-endopeptidase [Pseudorhodoferax sp.]